MTYAEMVREVADILKLADQDNPGEQRLYRTLNRAKDRLVARIEQVNQGYFIARQAYTPTQGDASVTLPTDCRRIIGLQRTDSGNEDRDIPIWSADEKNQRTLEVEGTVYLEADKLYFVSSEGAPSGIALQLRYAKRLTDATDATGSSSWSDIPGEFHALVCDMAAHNLLPGTNAYLPVLTARIGDQLEDLKAVLSRRVKTGLHVTRMDGW